MNAHDPYVKKITGAGQTYWAAHCRTCTWTGKTTSDKEAAQEQAAGHGEGSL